MKKLLYIIALVVVATSCLEGDDYHVKRTDVISISGYSIPDSIQVADTLQISATAEASNGCWSDLFFILQEENDSIYSMAAFGTFETYGTCPSGIVTRDTVIDLKLDSIGRYQFVVYRNSYQYDIDTLIVGE